MTAPSSPRYFVDTNIWLYAFMVGQDAVKSAKAQTVIKQHANNIIVSTQVINEVCVNLLKKAKLPEGDIKPIIESYFKPSHTDTVLQLKSTETILLILLSVATIVLGILPSLIPSI